MWILLAGISRGAEFNGEQAFRRLNELVSFGERYYGAPKREEAIEQMRHSFQCDQWISQDFVVQEPISKLTYHLTNKICRIAPEAEERLLLGTHFDTRLWAEEALVRAEQPIPGANDGTSGVVILMGISDLIKAEQEKRNTKIGVDLVLFDGEEFGRPGKGNYCKGSIHFAEQLEGLYPSQYPKRAVILDMVGDKDLQFRPELTSMRSAPELYHELWTIGERYAPASFSEELMGPINDDHTPLLKKGIPSVLLIDMSYPYWHTHQDTPDKCSVESLTLTGTVIWKWLEPQLFEPESAEVQHSKELQ